MSVLKNLISIFYDTRMKFSKHTGLGISVTSNIKKIKAPFSFYNIIATANNGEIIRLEKYKDKKILIVNVASKCGFTPQYNELEKLHNLYKSNVIILGFPSDDFGAQEPGNDIEIVSFCKMNFDITFQLFHKDHVKGVQKQPVYQWLCDAAKNGWNNEEPSWNFCKYLIDENGDLQKIFSSAVSPLSKEITNAISA